MPGTRFLSKCLLNKWGNLWYNIGQVWNSNLCSLNYKMGINDTDVSVVVGLNEIIYSVKSFLIVMPYYCYYKCSLSWRVLGIFIQTLGDSSQTQSTGNMLLSFSQKSCITSVYFFPSNYLSSWWQFLCPFAWWFLDDENRFWIRFSPAWSNWYSSGKMTVILYLFLEACFGYLHILVRI